MAAVEVERLVRSYAGNDALKGISLSIEPGEIRGLLGPNGAGKTTLCRILSTILLPTSGTATVLGHDVVRDAKAVKRSIGIVFGGEKGLYPQLTARQNLHFWAAMYGLRGKVVRTRVDALLGQVGLGDRADEPVNNFSRGMKQRVHLARGLVADPPVLILDEPTAGMDPVAAHGFRDLVNAQRAAGKTLLITTHDMAEAEAVCDRVTLMDRGEILVTDEPRVIGAGLGRGDRVRAVGVPAQAHAALRELPGVVVSTDAGVTEISTADSTATTAVLRVLVEAGVTEVSSQPPSLEEAYLHHVGRSGLAVGE